MTIDSEIIKYAAKSGATLTGCTRGDQSAYGGSAAASHLDQAKVGFYLTPQVVNQIIAEIIAMQTSVSNPNLCLNSDFGRRTVFGLAMPEVFADTSGYIKIDAGTAPSVSANILTFGAANNELAWCNGSFVWRDGRISATFKAVSTTGIYQLKWRISSTTWISAKQNNGNFTLTYSTATSDIVDTTTGLALTLNRWYWLEIEKQGPKVIVKIYDTGGTASGVTKAASTLQATLPSVSTFPDGATWAGSHPSITSDQATAQWGGIATGNGGVYVETWLPESWAVTFGGTLGGQAVGIDEAADAGPLGKQWALTTYTPANSRQITIAQPNTSRGQFPASTSVATSIYYKTTGASGSGLLTYYTVGVDGAGSDVDATHTLGDSSATSWARLSQTFTTGSTTRGFRFSVNVNVSSNVNGTLRVMLPQCEQGSAATAWRNAPADDAPIVWDLTQSLAYSTSSTTLAELDPRNFAANVFLPWDCSLVLDFQPSQVQNNTASDGGIMDFSVDGTTIGSGGNGLVLFTNPPSVIGWLQMPMRARRSLAAAKHRVAVQYAAVTGGFFAVGSTGRPSVFTLTAYRGK